MKDFDPKLHLLFEREVELPAAMIFEAWTSPEKLMPWFCPRPRKVTECRIDLRPGGEFFTRMQGPDGQETFAGPS
jgi:uncharacterized protein YndB with AHSA1/START domain